MMALMDKQRGAVDEREGHYDVDGDDVSKRSGGGGGGGVREADWLCEKGVRLDETTAHIDTCCVVIGENISRGADDWS